MTTKLGRYQGGNLKTSFTDWYPLQWPSEKGKTYKQWSTKHYTEKHTNNDLQNTTQTNIQTMIYQTLQRKTY